MSKLRQEFPLVEILADQKNARVVEQTVHSIRCCLVCPGKYRKCKEDIIKTTERKM
jgi:hypothetical protein